MDTRAFIIVALSILGFGLISRRIERTVFTAPMIFVGLGFLVSGHGLGWLSLEVGDQVIHTLAELTLVLVLFTDASRIDLSLLRREHDLPVRLLAIGMPLTLVLGAIVATLIFYEWSFWPAALLATILAPTDAALGQAVVSSSVVPVRIRQALNVESGLNDGIALPVVLILLAASCATEHHETVGYWFRFTAMQVTLGPLVGIAVGFLGAKAVERGVDSGWMSPAFQGLASLGLALLAFAGAESIGGNGFIAAFCAGLTLGNTLRSACERLYEFAEAEGQLLTLLIFMIFGAAMVPDALAHINGRMVLYAALSLTVIRMLPVALSLLGAKLRKESVLFLGWFGPRGLASILFGLLVVEASVLEVRHEILAVVMVTVLMSVIAHGLTAVPGASWYARRASSFGGESSVEEHMEVAEMPVRIRHSS